MSEPIERASEDFEAIDPVAYLAARLAPGGRIFFMPNGGNLGDNLIASATLQQFERAGLPWTFLRGQRQTVRANDLLVYGGGGSLVPEYTGGIDCLRGLAGLPAPVVVLPQTVRGHADFWRDAPPLTVFCRDAMSRNGLRDFPQVTALAAHDMAVGLDMAEEPFSTVLALRAGLLGSGRRSLLRAFRTDIEAALQPVHDTCDLSALAYPSMQTIESIHGSSCALLAALACHSALHTDRLHLAIAGGLLGLSVTLFENNYGKIRAVHEASLAARFPNVRLISAEDEPAALQKA